MKKCISILIMMTVILLAGCGEMKEKESDKVMKEKVVLTETGEVWEEEQPTATPDQQKNRKPLSEDERGDEKEQIDIENVQIDLPRMEEELVEEEPIEPSGSDLQIVFMGDSIFDFHRDGTGVPYLTAEQCDADIYNLAIGGTSASLPADTPMDNENWSSWCLVGVVKALTGQISTEVFEGTNAKNVLETPGANFKETDYFVIEYGINDFFQKAPLDDMDSTYNFYTYVGALRYAVVTLKEFAPDATVILCTPHYCQFFSGNQYIGDSNILNNGNGTVFDYKGKCSYVAREQNVEWLDAYFDLGIDGYTAKDYLEDGIHLTDEGRQLYADALAKKILKIEETKNN